MSMDPVKFPDGTLTPVEVSHRQLYAAQRAKLVSCEANVQSGVGQEGQKLIPG